VLFGLFLRAHAKEERIGGPSGQGSERSEESEAEIRSAKTSLGFWTDVSEWRVLNVNSKEKLSG